ncbi:MAG: hypothetical protein A4E28_00186 [Methanocella sp. PtaU1.Bin125]|nr:MAG: hypothetical protein A4E28_00186 [Methanocella sp. PtaU1.Bin125]
MNGPHGRAIKSTMLTITAYLQELRAALNEDNRGYDRPGDQLSPGERETADAAIANMEGIIERYFDEFGISKDRADLRWKIFVLAESMENLVHDIEPGRLGRKYGPPDSADEREQIEKLQEALREQIRLLKSVSSGPERARR